MLHKHISVPVCRRKYNLRTHQISARVIVAAKWGKYLPMTFHSDKRTVLSISQEKNPFHHNYIYTNVLHKYWWFVSSTKYPCS